MSQASEAFYKLASLLEARPLDKILILAQAGIAVRKLSQEYAEKPALCEDIDLAGQAISNLRLRLQGALEHGYAGVTDGTGV